MQIGVNYVIKQSIVKPVFEIQCAERARAHLF